MCADTCPNEQNVLAALRKEIPEKIPSFCQSIMENVKTDFDIRYGDTITEADILITPIGDLTLYKKFGYSSHWVDALEPAVILDDELRDQLDSMNEKLFDQGHEDYIINELGQVHATNKITTWFVEPGIRTEDQLRFFLDHWQYKSIPSDAITKYEDLRRQCFDSDFVPIPAPHVVMEPANQIISFALTAKLMRKNPSLLEDFYKFIVNRAEQSIDACIAAGFKVFCTPDDMAYKTGPMFAPNQYRQFVVPCAKRLCDKAHDANGVIFMHTDGFIDSVIDCFIEARYDGINPLEPTSGMTIARVKKKWGDKLACVGNVDTTNTLSFGTPKDVRRYVHRCFFEAKGDQDAISGYIFAASGSLHNHVQLDNALAMMDEYKKLREGEIPI